MKKRLKWIAISVVGFLLVLAGSAYGYIQYLNGKLHHTQITADKDGRPPAAAKDSQGRSPMNILLIGNDSRVGEGRRYGAEGHEGLADVAILMHLSADRSNATLVNIPRDTMVDIPRCEIGKGKDKKVTEARFGQFNDSFRSIGASCTVATVDRMLQVRTDHYIEVDFKGVRDLTDAVGGVPICLDAPIHDPVLSGQRGGTGLELPAGPNNLSGNDALQFLRARHAFGDGSDLARIEAQKVFLMALARELKNNAKLSNVDGMFKIANSAVSALTVDNDLAGVDKLIDLADEIKKVPEKRMAFTTLPTETYRPAPDQVQPRRPAADNLWAAIRADRPLTEGDPAADPPPPPVTVPPSAPPQTIAPADAAKIRVTVDTGTAKKRITPVVEALKEKGFKATSGTTMPDGREHANSRITYPEGKQDQAKAIATALGLPETALEVARSGDTTIELLIGADLPERDPNGSPTQGSSSTPPGAPPEPPKATDLNLETADNTKCASPRKK
ncbi:LCP family protein [Embleya sp. NBC_00896]|uniref:LCP family protein n=1 Tax=Embleya sp. NBC_00896 TaxID=2975961 RepID=UPI00386313BE|nr:LCP family protein [Embleya sp. NBC_00896]